MKVFKFGGASVKSAKAVRNVGDIISDYNGQKMVVVVSAMGKTTNALEKILKADSKDFDILITAVENFHNSIINKLFLDLESKIYNRVGTVYKQMRLFVNSNNLDTNKAYAEFVGFGEVLSTIIINQFLLKLGIASIWQDAGELIITEDKYIDARVLWDESSKKISSKINPLFDNNDIVILQGFIAKTVSGECSTLGREGSDYSAAIFANALDAQYLTIWKDVPGLLNADPKYFDNTYKLDFISYRETIELAYYGASIIHPKTIQPLKKKSIPLYIKSFLEPNEKGTTVQKDAFADSMVPSYIIKKNQVIVSLSARDFSFITEDSLSIIFRELNNNNLRVNLMQNSAISFSLCLDNKVQVKDFINDIQQLFKVRYNDDMELITIQNYNQELIDELVGSREVFLEQKSRTTVQLLVR
ncbi:MAG: aspartate kinase [Bacteroidales bacterium]|nr:aspartate kinase [Bacteroidales bacterium]